MITLLAFMLPLNNNYRPGTEDIRIGNLHLDKVQISELDRRINDLFRDRKPFLQANYTLGRLAQDTHVSLHHLSAFINHHYEMNFNDFINRCRIYYCITKITRTELKHKKIETIAKEFGFSNRNTFRIAFKRATGMMPSKYLKSKSTADGHKS